MRSVLAAWRVSLRRTRADWPIALAALLTMLLATTLLAAGPIYSSGVSLAGLRQTLAQASVDASNVEVIARVPPNQVATVDQQVSAELRAVAGTLPAELATLGSADVYALPGQAENVRDLAEPAFADGVDQHATLVAGAWPAAAGAASPSGAGLGEQPVEVAISDAVAGELGLSAGSQLDLVSRLDPGRVLPVTIAGVFRINDPADPYWWSDEQALSGFTESDQYRTFGPFLMSRGDLIGRAATTGVSMAWRLLPSYSGIAIADLPGLQARVDALPGNIDSVAGSYSPSVLTKLPGTLASARKALLVSLTGMLLVMAQLALLGGYSILLTAGLLIDHRRIETALLRARGAGPAHVAGLAAIEGLVLAAPAIALGPLCAVVALNVFDQTGPMAQVGLTVPLAVTGDAYLASGIAGAACVVVLALPALFSARAFSAEQQSVSRAETRPLAQRLGIDFALLLIAAIALWQLRFYGAPLTRTLQGTLGPDPLLIAAPGLGLLLGVVVATRLLPRMAEVGERLLTRRRGLVGALGGFQLARRPLRYTRSALMLMLALSIGVFAVSYATTWTDSQRSQADYQAGADVRVVPPRSSRALPAFALATAYANLPGVDQQMAVERGSVGVSRSLSATLLAIDARTAPAIVNFRPDQAGSRLSDLLAPLAAARPEIAFPGIPAGSTDLIAELAFDVRGLQHMSVDASTGQPVMTSADPALFDQDAAVGLSIAVRDAHGLIHRLIAAPATPPAARAGITLPLAGADGPLEVASIDVAVSLPQDLVVTDGSVSVARMSAEGSGRGPAPVDLGAPGTWQVGVLDADRQSIVPPSAAVEILGVNIGGDTTSGAVLPELAGGGPRPLTISMQPAVIAAVDPGAVPVIVNGATLADTALGPNGTFSANLDGTERALTIAGVVDSFPTTDVSEPLVIIDLPTIALLRLQSVHGFGTGTATIADARPPDEWWLDISPSGKAADGGAAAADQLSQLLRAAPFASASVITASGRLRALVSDPVAVGTIGALGLGAIAAGLFALIGLAVAISVSTRQRQAEFALVRALGLSRRQLAAWLLLENGGLAVVSVFFGTLLGTLISLVVLPSVTVTPDGLPPTPPVQVALPLASVALLVLVVAVALGALIGLMAALLRRAGIGNVLRLAEE